MATVAALVEEWLTAHPETEASPDHKATLAFLATVQDRLQKVLASGTKGSADDVAVPSAAAAPAAATEVRFRPSCPLMRSCLLVC